MKTYLFSKQTLLVLLLLIIVKLATAQPKDMNDKAPSTQKSIFLTMMDNMMMKMNDAPSGNSAGTDFISRMIPHHEGAIEMALYEIQHGKDFSMIQLAKSIIAEQSNEIQQMSIWVTQSPLIADNSPVGFKQSMVQCMTEMMQSMPSNSSLMDTDHAFARVMIPHHQAAIDMAKVALKYTKDQQISAFAKQLISSEQVEIEQMSSFTQSPYAHDRVYAANQISNTVSVVDPSTNTLLGEIKLGNPYPNVLNPLYRGQALVHGLRYSPRKKLLAVVSIGSNAVTLISTENNKVLKTIYVGRSPHEPTFTPDSKQLWVSVRGEAYISVIDVEKMAEVNRVPVADGPGMVAFTPDGKLAYVCSSFTPEVDVVSTSTYGIIKKIPVISPFSPNIFTSPKGEWIALTHKDVGKVTVINTADMSVSKVINTGAITNHVTFCYVNNKLLMLVTVGGENKVRVFDVVNNFEQRDTINVGALPHGLWPSADGKIMFVGLEYGDQVQGIDLQTMQVISTIQIGQSPQALVYADNAVSDTKNRTGLTPLNDTSSTQVIVLNSISNDDKAHGRLAVRSIGMADLVEQAFNALIPNTSYTLALSRSAVAPFNPDYEINVFKTDGQGKYNGQSTGLVKLLNTNPDTKPFQHVVLIENSSKKTILLDNLEAVN